MSDKREMKKRAAFDVYLLIESALDAGWEYEVMLRELGWQDPKDHERWHNGMMEIADEMRRRGETTDQEQNDG